MAKEKESEKISSYQRTIELVYRMMSGEKLTSSYIKEEYLLKERTFFRTMRAIKETFEDSEMFQYYHDRKTDQHYFEKKSLLSYSQVLSLVKILLGVRTFSKSELADVLDNLRKLMNATDQANLDHELAKMLGNYHPVHTKADLTELVAKFDLWIREAQPIIFDYKSSAVNGVLKQDRLALPLSLYFAGSYFYVIMYLPDKKKPEMGTIYPFRIDRFENIKQLKKGTIMVPQAQKEEIKKIRDQSYKLSSGSKDGYVFKFSGYPQMALDQLPGSYLKKDSTGKIYHDADGDVIIQGQLSHNGALIWVLGQGTKVKVLAPQSLIEDVSRILHKSANYYPLPDTKKDVL